ncbi:uncharacterized protein [Drosophila virilis]|uniref:Uncharacterized protein, isoform A n=1 Tax=Drosophila virilis TaxID=7244 RepID=B4M505_DROVI|nr:uncharacterized protein LOC6633155 [Drosophila virilis]EDW59716.1 uncharacterized protein Dvir_GJ11035, isoform A [Drosophila virilis]KRF79033.1 uncharacterized protein Dvir_GJ11035, isoform B [Drosophila virilis]
MQKSQRTQCWTLLLLGALIVSFGLMFSYWYLVPSQLHIWQLFRHNGSPSSDPAAAELKFFMPPQTVPKELNLKRGAPYIYQILH